MPSVPLLLLVVGLLLLLVRVLHLASQAAPPSLVFKDSPFNRNVLSMCSLLLEAYVPPLLWGKSGHLQTIVYGKMGRINSPFPRGERKRVKMADGATVSYDVFEPHDRHPSGGDYTLLICPGIANSSESAYICTCVDFAQGSGYRVAVLNHLGALKAEPLTAPRMFNYGDTDEYDAMVEGVRASYPGSKLIVVGFSMGGNIVLKWLCEREENQAKVLAAISCCQGYSAHDAASYLMSWEHLRRVYLWAMTQHQLLLLRRHRATLLEGEAARRYGPFDTGKIFSATSLVDIDQNYTAPRFGFKSEMEYYHWSSCAPHLHKLRIPAFILNACDDPIVPNDLHHYPKNLAESRDNVIFATTRHGGHLGYFEGGLLAAQPITWLDKVIVQYADAVLATLAQGRGVKGQATAEVRGKGHLNAGPQGDDEERDWMELPEEEGWNDLKEEQDKDDWMPEDVMTKLNGRAHCEQMA